MSHIERLTPRPALHQNCVDFPVSANTVHCIKTAWIFWNCGIASLHRCIKTAWIFRAAPTISTSYKLWQTRKNRVVRKISAEETRELHGHGARAFGSMLRVEAETAPTTIIAVIIIGDEHRRLTRSVTERDTETETETERLRPHTADRAAIPSIRRRPHR
jgi:hypothetical protein